MTIWSQKNLPLASRAFHGTFKSVANLSNLGARVISLFCPLFEVSNTHNKHHITQYSNTNVAHKLLSTLKLHNVGWSWLGAITILSCDVMTWDTYKNVVFSWECTLLSTNISDPVTDKLVLSTHPNAIGWWSESVLNHFLTNLLHVVNN